MEQLSQRTGVSKSVISEAFAGRRLPTENTVRKLVAALDDDVDVTAWVERRSGIDPFTKRERVFAAKPTTMKVRALALMKLRNVAL